MVYFVINIHKGKVGHRAGLTWFSDFPLGRLSCAWCPCTVQKCISKFICKWLCIAMCIFLHVNVHCICTYLHVHTFAFAYICMCIHLHMIVHTWYLIERQSVSRPACDIYEYSRIKSVSKKRNKHIYNHLSTFNTYTLHSPCKGRHPKKKNRLNGHCPFSSDPPPPPLA